MYSSTHIFSSSDHTDLFFLFTVFKTCIKSSPMLNGAGNEKGEQKRNVVGKAGNTRVVVRWAKQ